MNLHIFYRETDKRLAESKHYSKENLQEKREKIFSSLLSSYSHRGALNGLPNWHHIHFFTLMHVLSKVERLARLSSCLGSF